MSKDTALLVIDMQVGLLHDDEDDSYIYRHDEVLACINQLLARARDTGTSIIYIQHDGHVNHPLKVGTPGWQIHPAIAPETGELVVHKRVSDAFHETSLQHELQTRGITHLVITGAMTEFCMDTTSRRATIMGYDATVVADGHTTWDRDSLPAAQAVAYYNDILVGFGTREHVITVKSAQDIHFI